eukprot:1054989-Ditylum_brightwellii.AAC.1
MQHKCQRGQRSQCICQRQINETNEEHDCNMQAMRNFEDLSLSSINKSVQIIIGDISKEGGHGQKQTGYNLKDNKI